MDVIEFKDETLKSTILQLLVSNQTEVLSMIPTKRSLEEILWRKRSRRNPYPESH